MDNGQKVLIIGNGSREHALSELYEASNHVSNIVVAPGNDFVSFKRDKLVRSTPHRMGDLGHIIKLAHDFSPDIATLPAYAYGR